MDLSETAKLFQANPDQSIERVIKEFIDDSPSGRLSFLNGYRIWGEPLVRFADGDDPIFAEYKTIITPVHLTPREALAKSYNMSQEEIPKRLSVISWILPAAGQTRKASRIETRVPSSLWSHTRWYGEMCNVKLGEHLVKLLVEAGYMAVAPMSQPYFRIYPGGGERRFSNWSERHIAYAAGQGTFSLSDGLITERGIAHRCSSVVTSLELPPSSRTAANHLSNCLFYAGVSCRACIDRCPAGAITGEGHDKSKCQQYLEDIGYSAGALKDGYDNDNSVAGCGLCQTKVPCEFENPVAKLKKKPERQPG